MKLNKIALFFISTLTTLSAMAEPVEVTVRLSPAGSFVMKSPTVKGTVVVDGNKVKATDIRVPTKSLKTGIALRDKHTWERLKAEKFPEIILTSANGEASKGEGKLTVGGIEKPVKGTYEVVKGVLHGKFKLSLKDFEIEKINYLGVGVKDEVEVKVEVPIRK